MLEILAETSLRRFTVEEYYRMTEVGLLSSDERVELVDGILYRMSPEGTRHAVAIDVVAEQLRLPLQSRHHVRSQHPMAVSDDTEPQPDIAVVEASDPRAYLAGHPATALLVVEVAESSLAKDVSLKPRTYARAGVPEYWVLSLVDNTLVVFRDPFESWYRARLTLRRGDRIRLVAVADVEIEVSALFP